MKILVILLGVLFVNENLYATEPETTRISLRRAYSDLTLTNKELENVMNGINEGHYAYGNTSEINKILSGGLRRSISVNDILKLTGQDFVSIKSEEHIVKSEEEYSR